MYIEISLTIVVVVVVVGVCRLYCCFVCSHCPCGVVNTSLFSLRFATWFSCQNSHTHDESCCADVILSFQAAFGMWLMFRVWLSLVKITW